MRKLIAAAILALGLSLPATAEANHHFGGCEMGHGATVAGYYTSDLWVAWTVWYEHGYEQRWDLFQDPEPWDDVFLYAYASEIGDLPWNATIVNVDIFTGSPHSAGLHCD